MKMGVMELSVCLLCGTKKTHPTEVLLERQRIKGAIIMSAHSSCSRGFIIMAHSVRMLEDTRISGVIIAFVRIDA